MNVLQAIKRADELRPNGLSDELKAGWLHQLDGRVAEIMQADVPLDTWPNDRELLMPYPYDNIYELWLACMIDHAQQDMQLYNIDQIMFNSAMDDARAWWRRNNRPKTRWGGVMIR